MDDAELLCWLHSVFELLCGFQYGFRLLRGLGGALGHQHGLDVDPESPASFVSKHSLYPVTLSAQVDHQGSAVGYLAQVARSDRRFLIENKISLRLLSGEFGRRTPH